MLSCFKKRFLAQILLDILRPVAIRFLSRIVHGNCLFDELVNLKFVLMGGNRCWTQPSCFLSRKTKQPNHRKIDPQLVTGTTCTPPSPTYPHLATWFRSGLEMCSPRPVCHQVTENFLPWGTCDYRESPLERGLVLVGGFPTSGGLLGWWPWLVEKKISINCNGWNPNLRNKFWGMRKFGDS